MLEQKQQDQTFSETADAEKADQEDHATNEYREKLSDKGVHDEEDGEGGNFDQHDLQKLDDYQEAERYSKGDMEFTNLKVGKSDEMEMIKAMLANFAIELAHDREDTIHRKSTADQENENDRDALVRNAGEAYANKMKAFQGLQETASSNHKASEEKVSIARSAKDAAESRAAQSRSKYNALSVTSPEDIARYRSEAAHCASQANATAMHDTEKVNQQRQEANSYIAQEEEVLRQIQELLKDLNLDVPSSNAGDGSYAMLETSKRVTLSAQQKRAVRVLEVLAGRLDKNAHRYTSGSDHDTESIHALLTEVGQGLEKEKTSVNEQYQADMAQIQREKEDQLSHCESIFHQQRAEATRRLNQAEREMRSDISTVTSRANDLTTALFDESKRKGILDGVMTRVNEGRNEATESRDSAVQDILSEFKKRQEAINAMFTTDMMYIDLSIKAVQHIQHFIGKFATLLQTKYVKRESYIAHSSLDAKTRIATLLIEIEAHLASEQSRIHLEKEEDLRRLDDEKKRADTEAKDNMEDDLAKLWYVRQQAAEKKAAADADLKKATDHHEAVSNRHNADRDTLATAEEIQKKNLKAFKTDRDQTLDLSSSVYNQENEIIVAKQKQAMFYLNAELETLEEIRRMLTHVNLLGATSYEAKTTNGFEEASAEGHAAGAWNLHHNAATWNGINSEEMQRSRQGGDDYSNTERSDVDDHHLTNFRGEKVKFDDAGELKSEPAVDFVPDAELDVQANSGASRVDSRMLNDHRDEALMGTLLQIGSRHGLSQTATSSRSREGGLTIEEYLRLVISQVHDEMDRVKEDFASEIQRISETRDALHDQARSHYEHETFEDAERVRVAQEAHDKSYVELQAAHVEKVEATKASIQRAAILRDAIATQSEQAQKVRSLCDDILSSNDKNHDRAVASVKKSAEDADKYLEKEKAVVRNVAFMVDGMDAHNMAGQLVQIVSKITHRAIQRIAATKYDFSAKRATKYEDKQEGTYDATQIKGSEDYQSTFFREGGLKDVITKLEGELQDEIKNVALRHSTDVTALTSIRNEQIAEVMSAKNAEKQKLLDHLKTATEEHAESEHAFGVVGEAVEKVATAKADMEEKLRLAKAAQAQNMAEMKTYEHEHNMSAVNEYTSEVHQYKRLYGDAMSSISYERDIIKAIRHYLSHGFSGKTPDHAQIETCSTLRLELESAKSTASAKKAACVQDRIAENGNEVGEKFGRDPTACPAASTAATELDSAKEAYEACLKQPASDAVFLSMKSVRSAVQTLSKKYMEDTHDSLTEANVDGMMAILSQVEDKLNKAEVKAKETFESDKENSRHKLDAEMMRIKERVTTELEAHQAEVDISQQHVDGSTGMHSGVKAHYDHMEIVVANHAAAQDAAQSNVNMMFPILEQEATQRIESIETIYLDNKLEIDNLAQDNTVYLQGELDTLHELTELLKSLILNL